MNERIRELAEQAVQLVADEHTKGDVSRLNTDAYHVKDLINEKFAELIVLECASQVRFTDLLKCNDDSDGEILLQASVQLKQHFGVE